MEQIIIKPHRLSKKEWQKYRYTRKRSKRLALKIGWYTKESLAPLYKLRVASRTIVEEAEKLELMEVLRLLSTEKVVKGKYATIDVLPTTTLIAIAKHYYVPPALFVRAAAIKLAQRLDAEASVKAAAGAVTTTTVPIGGSDGEA